MKTYFILFSITLIFRFMHAEQINPETDLHVPLHAFSVPFSYSYTDEAYILVLSRHELPVSLKQLCYKCGYDVRQILFADTANARTDIADSIDLYGYPHCLLITGSYDSIPLFNGWYNPYSGRQYLSDAYYTVSGLYPAGIPCSRIPLDAACAVNAYIGNVCEYMQSCTTCINLMSPFYDSNNDGMEDYLYCSILHDAGYALSCNYRINPLYSTDSGQPAIFYSGSCVPDSLRKPYYDWLPDYPDFCNCLDAPSLTIYRGHGNAVSTVSPVFPMSYLDSMNISKNMFCGFACLLADLSNGKCLIDSMFNAGFLYASGSSSETFYQYNNWMCRFFMDCIDDNVIPDIHTVEELCICRMFNNACSNLLKYMGINEYSLCQARSYIMLGMPFMGPVSAQISLEADVSLIFNNDTIEIWSSDSCICILSNAFCIENRYELLPGINMVPVSTLHTECMHYVSCLKCGCLAIDSFMITEMPVMKNEHHVIIDNTEPGIQQKSVYNAAGSRCSVGSSGVYFGENGKFIKAGGYEFPPQ